MKHPLQLNKLTDSIAAVEMTWGLGGDTRAVHPLASEHYRQTLHADLKTDDHDWEAILRAAINGYAVAILPVDPTCQTLQALVHHRRNLVNQRSRCRLGFGS